MGKYIMYNIPYMILFPPKYVGVVVSVVNTYTLY